MSFRCWEACHHVGLAEISSNLPFTSNLIIREAGTSSFSDETAFRASTVCTFTHRRAGVWGVEARRRRRSRCGRYMSVSPAGQGTTVSSPSARACREHWQSNRSTSHMQPCYCALARTCSNFNRLQLRSKAVSGPARVGLLESPNRHHPDDVLGRQDRRSARHPFELTL